MVWQIWANPILANPFLANLFLCCVVVCCCVVLYVVVSVLLSVCCCCVLLLCVGVGCWLLGVGCWCWCGYFGPSGSPLAPNPPADLPARTPLLWTPCAGPPYARPPKISLFFSVSRSHFHSFCLSLGVFTLNFGGVFEGQDNQMCTFGVLGQSCETPAASGQPGLHMTVQRTPYAHIPGLWRFKHHQNSTRKHPRVRH